MNFDVPNINQQYRSTEGITSHTSYQVVLGRPSQTAGDCQWRDWREMLPRPAAKCRRVSATLPVSPVSARHTSPATVCRSSRLSAAAKYTRSIHHSTTRQSEARTCQSEVHPVKTLAPRIKLGPQQILRSSAKKQHPEMLLL